MASKKVQRFLESLKNADPQFAEFFDGYITVSGFTALGDSERGTDLWNSRGEFDVDVWDEIKDVVDDPGLMDAIHSCMRFLNDCRAEVVEVWPLVFCNLKQAGSDFAYTRNGHGVGFWSRDDVWDGLGDRLTEMCKPYGELNMTGIRTKGGRLKAVYFE